MDEDTSLLELISSYEPDRIVLEVDAVRKYTYGDLVAEAHRVSAQLKALDIARGSVFRLETPSAFRFIVELVGALDAGMTVLPFPPQLSAATKSALGGVNTRTAEGSALIHLTSGSAGASKLVIRPLDNLYDEAFGVASVLNLKQMERVCISTPMQHSFGSGILFGCLYAGSTILAPDQDTLTHKLRIIRTWIANQRVRVLVGVPYVFQQLLRESFEAQELLSWSGGEPLQPSLVYRWNRITGGRIWQEYGLSEGGIVSFGSRKDPVNSVGHAITGVRVGYFEDTRELEVWRTGSLRYYGGESGTFTEYGSIRTGDLGVISSGGLITVIGRIKSVIIVAGMKVTPGEIEAELCSEPGVLDAQVFGFPDDRNGQKPVAFVIRSDSSDVTELELKRALKTRMETYKVPARVIFVPDFPRTASGKVDRIELLKSAAYRESRRG